MEPWSVLLNKKVIKITQSSINVVMIHLDDGSIHGVEAEPVGHGIYAPVLNPGSVYRSNDNYDDEDFELYDK